mgnify:CR=1 FL=1
MNGRLYTAVWPYKKLYYMGVVLFTDMNKYLKWCKRTGIMRKCKISAKEDAEELRREILGL